MEAINKKNFKPNTERMNIIAKSLGVSIGEVFQIQFFTHKNVYKDAFYKLTNEGLFYKYKCGQVFTSKSDALEGLLVGKHQVIRSAK